ncbi:hypothetical protein SAMN04487898_115158 [Pedobacter sp. ok626]|uniref:hypothetical protein n=1 Tax=Pedobacter sp. ok626 TaxID=1761882 RepID=UPI00088C341B|nr:hypothetical protein [Pedobacter sp. ok626]SDL16251.1 hypothetical protein SAMN04487898_115158 [Pedobacter sp. ok626]
MKNSIFKLVGVMCIAILPILLLLYSYKNQLEKKSYSFTRKIIYPLERMDRVKLDRESYYLAGVASEEIYLANNYNTGWMLSFDQNLKQKKIKLNLSKANLVKDKGQYRAHISDGRFYLYNGLGRSILSGTLEAWTAFNYPIFTPYFQDAVAMGAESIVFRYVNSRTGQNSILKTTYNDKLENINLLQKQVDGLYCTSGMLKYNKALNKLIYLYYYRNQILQIDTNLNLAAITNTIDPIDSVKFTSATIKSENKMVQTSPPILVNAHCATWGNYLYVHSKVMGRREDNRKFDNAAVIDVYDLKLGSYLHSFYLHNQNKTAISDLLVDGNVLYTISGQYLNKYTLER